MLGTMPGAQRESSPTAFVLRAVSVSANCRFPQATSPGCEHILACETTLAGLRNSPRQRLGRGLTISKSAELATDSFIPGVGSRQLFVPCDQRLVRRYR